MRFSIITPSFNQGRFLPMCVESVLSQEGVEFEHIVTDAGSQRQQPACQDAIADQPGHRALPLWRQAATAAEPKTAQCRPTPGLAFMVEFQGMAQHLGLVEQAAPPLPVIALGQQAVKIAPDHRRQRVCLHRRRRIATQVETAGTATVQADAVGDLACADRDTDVQGLARTEFRARAFDPLATEFGARRLVEDHHTRRDDEGDEPVAQMRLAASTVVVA